MALLYLIRDIETEKNKDRDKMKNQSPPESWEQEMLFVWIRANQIKYPLLQLAYSTLNGVKLGAKTRVAAKKQGNRRGVPDVVLPVRSADGCHCGLYLELKRIEGGRLSDEQFSFLVGVIAEGYKGVVVNGHAAAIAELKQYLGIDAHERPVARCYGSGIPKHALSVDR